MSFWHPREDHSLPNTRFDAVSPVLLLKERRSTYGLEKAEPPKTQDQLYIQ